MTLNRFIYPGNRIIRIPEQIEKLGMITYQGNFTGFIDDFVAFGKFNTGLGISEYRLAFQTGYS